MPKNLQPPRAASRILSYFTSRHVPQILGDLMEEFNERVASAGLSAARRWYWRAAFRNMMALAAGGQMSGKARPKTLFMISGVWLGLALVSARLSRGWLLGVQHQAWGVVTVVIFLVYFVLVAGWLVPMLWALINLFSRAHTEAKHIR